VPVPGEEQQAAAGPWSDAPGQPASGAAGPWQEPSSPKPFLPGPPGDGDPAADEPGPWGPHNRN